jgi:hypothetical protein
MQTATETELPRGLGQGTTRRAVLVGVAGLIGLHCRPALATRAHHRRTRHGQDQGHLQAAAAPHTPVTIATVGAIVDGSQSGTFTATGGIGDTGTFQFHEDVPRDFTFGGIGAPTFGIVRAVEFFTGQQGTFDLQTRIKFTVADGVATVAGTWTVLRGTAAYESLRGQGTISGTISGDPEQFLLTFQGSVH